MNRRANNTNTLSFFYDYVVENNIIYFPLANYNAICKGNLLNDQVNIIDIFPNISSNRKTAYSGVYKFGDYLLFSPHSENNCDEVLIYNILQHAFSYLPNKQNIDFHSGTVFKKEHYIYIVSVITAEIYKIDMQNISMQCITCKEYQSDNAQISELIRIENSILIPLNQQKVMLIFDLESEEFDCYMYPENILYISTLLYYEGKLWITGNDRNIYTWDIKAGVCKYVEIPDDVHPFYGEEVYFGASFINKNFLWLFPISTEKILKYNILTGCFEKVLIAGEEEENEGLEEGRFFSSKYLVKKYENKVFFMSSKTRILYELNLITNDIKSHYFKLANTFKGELYPIFGHETMREENYNNGLLLLIKNLKENDVNSMEVSSVRIGEKVNEYINNEVKN